MWMHIAGAWEYEHGVLIIALGTIAKRAFPRIRMPDVLSQHFQSDWGWFTIYRLPGARGLAPPLMQLSPENETEMSIVGLGLPQAKDAGALADKFTRMLSFLGDRDDIYETVAKGRGEVNANLETLLRDGRLLRISGKERNSYWPGCDNPPRRLKANEVFMNGRIYNYTWDKDWMSSVRTVIDLQADLSSGHQ